VSQGTWKIEGVEVTRANYQAFVLAKRGDTGGQGPACAQNISYTPGFGWPPLPADAQLPMVRADWCDATAYCKWIGGRLCGLIGGGSGANGSTEAPSAGQWAHACTGGNAARTFAYGTTYVAGRCNEGPALAAIGSFAQCEGAASKLYDMSGNVGEWVDDCTGEYCTVSGARGSSSETELGPEDRHRCNSRWTYPRMSEHDSLGFRCCSNP
jgi:formylglycine-generating enzyme required for sulfatase activity